MIGSGLRKFAQEKNMTVGHGVAYGLLAGYCTTLSEGGGWKKISVSTYFADSNARFGLQQKLSQLSKEMQKAYRVQSFGVGERRIEFVLTDTVGTMKCLSAFVDWIFPLLEQSGAAKANVCPECGMALIGGRWKLVDGAAICVHEACGQKLQAQMQDSAQAQKAEGSYLTGAVGALIGAAGGAVAWALLGMLGYISALVGLLMGFLADKCYDLFRGKRGYGKLAILAVSVIAGVFAGTYAAYVAEGVKELGLSIADSMKFINLAIENDLLKDDFTKDCVMGIIFAALGVIGLFMKTKQQVSAPKYIDLD